MLIWYRRNSTSSGWYLEARTSKTL